MKREFIDKVRNAVFYDTKKYRYRAQIVARGPFERHLPLVRLPLESLGTTDALGPWEVWHEELDAYVDEYAESYSEEYGC